ncbi:MAG: GNAT family acetyltransferase [Oscillospiraceae bacterium]|nr:GNAT family acetyltransferase [Oscillospiraceae bacterium]
MKYLIMCEGPNELEIMNILLENELLIYTEDDLLGTVPYFARQIDSSPMVKSALTEYPYNDVAIIRIGDKQSEELQISKCFSEKISGGISKYCTLPELEVLLIISEGLWNEYLKVKSKEKPKSFAKKNIKFNRKKYDNSSLFYKNYYGDSPEKLVAAIKEYKQKHSSHKKDELYLADILK